MTIVFYGTVSASFLLGLIIGVVFNKDFTDLLVRVCKLHEPPKIKEGGSYAGPPKKLVEERVSFSESMKQVIPAYQTDEPTMWLCGNCGGRVWTFKKRNICDRCGGSGERKMEMK